MILNLIPIKENDPTPNKEDTVGFADAFMQIKKDGHIRFYTEQVLNVLLCGGN